MALSRLGTGLTAHNEGHSLHFQRHARHMQYLKLTGGVVHCISDKCLLIRLSVGLECQAIVGGRSRSSMMPHWQSDPRSNARLVCKDKLHCICIPIAMKLLLVALIASAFYMPWSAVAHCPNHCNGHGRCEVRCSWASFR